MKILNMKLFVKSQKYFITTNFYFALIVYEAQLLSAGGSCYSRGDFFTSPPKVFFLRRLLLHWCIFSPTFEYKRRLLPERRRQSARDWTLSIPQGPPRNFCRWWWWWWWWVYPRIPTTTSADEWWSWWWGAVWIMWMISVCVCGSPLILQDLHLQLHARHGGASAGYQGPMCFHLHGKCSTHVSSGRGSENFFL